MEHRGHTLPDFHVGSGPSVIWIRGKDESTFGTGRVMASGAITREDGRDFDGEAGRRAVAGAIVELVINIRIQDWSGCARVGAVELAQQHESGGRGGNHGKYQS
jgi:hypothetical protein